MAKKNSCTSILVWTALLAGCSGGGGGGAATTVPATPTPAPAVQANGTVPLNLQAAGKTVSYPVASTFDGAGPVSTQNGTITLTTDANGNINKLAFDFPGRSLGVIPTTDLSSPRTADAVQLNGILSQTFGFPNTFGFTLSQVAGSQTLSASAYGVWADDMFKMTGDGRPFAFGNLTPAASVPATGSATYNGSVIGIGLLNDSNGFALDGKVQVVANFSDQSVTASLTNLRTVGVPGALPDLTGAVAISGNAYSGSIAGGALKGSIGGNFYGAGAAETAGVFQASGDGNYLFGSYGAKK